MKRRSITIVVSIAGIVFAGLALTLHGCSREPGHGGSGVVLAQPAESQQDFGEVAPFALTERSGARVKREDLLGEPWVASCIFTRCTGPCPTVTSTMKKLGERLKGSPAKLVSFSVDPEYDTPEVLKQYAEAAGADPKRWLFLTGPTADIDVLVRQSFMSAVERNLAVPVGQHVSHSTRLVVVDKQGRVRGMYSGESDVDLDAIVARVKFLEREQSSQQRAAMSLPLVNACLNGTSAVLLCAGLAAIKRGDRKLHERLMYAAFATSTAFLASYLYYHFVVIPKIGVTKYNGDGWLKTGYYAMLVSHVLLAIVNLPLSIRTLYLARKERWDAHKRSAKVTFPIWLYVSVTGVLVYLVLYVWNPPPPAA